MVDLKQQFYRGYDDPFILTSEIDFIGRYFENSEDRKCADLRRMNRIEDFVPRPLIHEMTQEEFELLCIELKNEYPLFREILFKDQNLPMEFVKPIGSGGFSTVYLGVIALSQLDDEHLLEMVKKCKNYFNKKYPMPLEGIISEIQKSDDPRKFFIRLLARLPEHMKCFVAKVLDRDYVSDRDSYGRFKREIKILGKLRHPNIVLTLKDPILWTCENLETVPLYVMEYLPNSLSWQEPCALTKAIPAILGVAKALYTAHTAGIIHRDVKPSNIRQTIDGVTKLTDFGCAKKTELYRTEGPRRTSTPETGLGHIIGSVEFMSPEQAQAHSVDHRTDIFSLGTTMYKIITGNMPYNFKDDHDSITRCYLISMQDQEPITKYADSIFVDTECQIIPSSKVMTMLKNIHRRATARDLDKRYPDMLAFIKDLELVQIELIKENGHL